MSVLEKLAHSNFLRRKSSQVLLFGVGLFAASCSKGGMPDQPLCGRLEDTPTGTTGTTLPKMLYAELRTAATGLDGATIGVNLTGSGGIYSGMYAFNKCDAPGTYYAERLVLLSAAGNPVATAVRAAPNNSYNVTYQNGNTTNATGAFANSITYSLVSPIRPLNVVTLQPSATSARQGDRLQVQIALSDEAGCGVKESQWWLTSVSTPGAKGAEPTTISGGSGGTSVHVGSRLTAGTYVIEGMVTLNNGRVMTVRRASSTDTTYKLYDVTGSVSPGDLAAPVIQITVTDNPDADRTPPVAWGATATPVGPTRCDPVSLSLLVTDDKGIADQTVKMILGTADKPNLATATLSGNGLLSGTFTVPSDAPFGLWYAYPEVVRDAAGNEARGVFANGRFHLVGDGSVVMTDVMAGAFILTDPAGLKAPDLGVPTIPDGGLPLPDMAGGAFPATLANVTVMATMPPTKVGDTVTIQMSWNDLAMIL